MTDTPIKVLMIDDEAFLLSIYRIAFEKAGFEVRACTSADEGLEVLRGGYTPDVILNDITMPEKNGYEFLEDMRAEGLAKKSIVVALTNAVTDGGKERIRELGEEVHLVKAEYVPHEIVEVVRNLIEKKR